MKSKTDVIHCEEVSVLRCLLIGSIKSEMANSYAGGIGGTSRTEMTLERREAEKPARHRMSWTHRKREK